MEEQNILLEEIRKQNRYLRSQLICTRIVMTVILLIAVGIGSFVCIGYPAVQEDRESVMELTKKADEMMTDIQTMSKNADAVVQQAGKMLEILKPQAEELANLDLEMMVTNINDLSKNVEALKLGELQKAIEGLQKAMGVLAAFAR